MYNRTRTTLNRLSDQLWLCGEDFLLFEHARSVAGPAYTRAVALLAGGWPSIQELYLF